MKINATRKPQKHLGNIHPAYRLLVVSAFNLNSKQVNPLSLISVRLAHNAKSHNRVKSKLYCFLVDILCEEAVKEQTPG